MFVVGQRSEDRGDAWTVLATQETRIPKPPKQQNSNVLHSPFPFFFFPPAAPPVPPSPKLHFCIPPRLPAAIFPLNAGFLVTYLWYQLPPQTNQLRPIPARSHLDCLQVVHVIWQHFLNSQRPITRPSSDSAARSLKSAFCSTRPCVLSGRRASLTVIDRTFGSSSNLPL